MCLARVLQGGDQERQSCPAASHSPFQQLWLQRAVDLPKPRARGTFPTSGTCPGLTAVTESPGGGGQSSQQPGLVKGAPAHGTLE